MSDLQNRLKKLTPEQRAILEKKLREKALKKTEENKIQLRKDMDKYPMSYEQERLWFLNQLNPDSAFYNMPAALKITGKLNIGILENSLREIITKHQILSAKYINDKNGPKQELIPIDFKLTAESIDREELEEVINQEANLPFDLLEGPLYRIKLFQLSEKERILLITFHHIVADGWSIGVLISELSQTYEEKIKNENYKLAESRIQYFDYAEWRRNSFTNEVKEKELTYWKNKLENMPQVLELPIDKTRPPQQKNIGNRLKFNISNDLHKEILKIAKENGASPFIIYLTILEIALYRWTNQDDFGIGTPSNGRSNPEVKSLIGFFVNTIVIRAQMRRTSSFEELLNDVKQTVLESFDHQNLPFENLVDAIVKEKSITNTPLFQVMFDYQESPLKNINLTDLKLEVIEQEIFVSKFDLLFLLEDDHVNQNMVIEFNSEIFESSTINILGDIILNLINSIVDNPKEKIGLLPIVNKEYMQELLEKWNQTKTDYPHDLAAHKVFELQCKKTPNNKAIVNDELILDYKSLNEKANQLANYLIKADVNLNDNIAIFMDRSIDLIISILGILKSGGVYVPIDPSYPLDRIQFMLKDTDTKFVLTQSSYNTATEKFSSDIIYIDEISNILENEDKSNPDIEISSDSIAYIMYTSGSTGKPKGVSVPHKGINRLVINTNYVEINENSKIAQVANTSFDASTFEIWGALLNGAELVILKKEDIINPQYFVKNIIEKNISTILLTTALFNQIALENPNAFATLDTLLIGGEKLDPATIKIVLENKPPKRLCNGYGPTENTTFSNCYLITNVDESINGIPIGKPIANSTAYVLDEDRNYLPIGVAGELYVGGDGLAKGYWNRKELTEKVFIKNPFSNKENDFLYKTGDLAKYRADGNIEFIGRIDSQVKMRGFRIELGEIESVLKNLDNIKDAVVLMHGESSIDNKLVAYIVSDKDDNQSTEEITRKISSYLPDYMIPKVYLDIEKVPLTPNGKVDKKALLGLEINVSRNEKNFVPPRTNFEKYLADIWKDILKIKEVSVYDSFFELGGNSLQAAVFINRLKKMFDTEIQVQSIFLAPTIDDFSKYASEYYSEIIEEKFNDGNLKNKLDLNIDDIEVLSEKKIEDFRNIIVNNSLPINESGEKNPSAIFILSPPRSGSTLLRVMLEGHDKLFSPPELDLLTFNSLKERRKILSGDLAFWLEATTRSVMELKNCSVEEAEIILKQFEDEDLSIKDFYKKIQLWAGEKILVDKTPTYAMDINNLEKAEQYFENPLYIHLIRNPYASIYSFIEAKLDKNFFRYKHDFNRLELAELIWMNSHKNINKFLKKIPNERKIQLRFEDLVTDSELYMKKLAEFLNIEYDEKLINPYQGNRMTDAVKENSQMVGDFKFYLRDKIDNKVTDRWKNYHTKNFLCEESIKVSEELGYDVRNIIVDKEDSSIKKLPLKKIDRTQKLPLSFAQQRLWFLDQLEPGKATYNIPTVVNLKGKINIQYLTDSINKIVERQESLRTSIITDEGKAYQNISEKLVININHYDFSKEDNRNNKIDEIINSEAKKPFDLSILPLLRVSLITLNAEEHILILNIHHIIADGWSLDIFVKELAIIYSNMVSGGISSLPELEYQYADFSAWQRDWMETSSYQKEITYWKDKLNSVPELLNLPTDFPRPSVQKQIGKKRRIVFNNDLVIKINEYAKAKNLTRNVIFLAAFNILLHKYSRTDDIVIGTPVAGRNQAEIEPIFGLFVNTLVLRNFVSGDQNIKQFLQNVNQTLVEAINNQDIPFEKLIDELNIERSLSHSPLFQVMFVYNNSPVQDIELPNLYIEPEEVDLGTSKFDLNFVITKRNTKYTAILEYDTSLFENSTIERMIKSYIKILNSIVSGEASIINEVDFIDDNEKKLLLSEFVGERHNSKITTSLHEVLENKIHEFSQNIAVELNNSSITFDELNKRSNQLANYLLKEGLQREQIVAVCLERSIDSIICIFAIWKAGAVYLPLDPNYPANRLSYMLEDSNAQILITSSEIANELNHEGNSIIVLGEKQGEIEKEESNNPKLDVCAENVAYMIYTSGSTGKPKGVMVQHQSALNLAYGLNSRIYSKYENEKLKISLNAPLPFDASMQEIVMLLFGHTLVIIPEEIRLDGNALLEYIRSKRIDLFDCVPTQLKILIECGLLSESDWTPRILLPGGEPIDNNMWEQLSETEKIDTFNMYGPTECTVDSTICEISNSLSKPSIGKPIDNSVHYVLDEELNICPIGVPGELYIGGECLSRGYYNKPDITAERFIPDPFGNKAGNRIYKTGDLVRFMNDGNIEYLGRLDGQVKLRGFRIELGEIESVLNSYDSIKNSVVLVKEDENNNKKLVGYYISDTDNELSINELKNYIGEKLPDYMVPSIFMKLDKFPLLPNKKINKSAFPLPVFSRDHIESEFENAKTDIEKILQKIWKEILKVDEIGINDNFFELGGDSILGIQVISKASQSGVKISPKNLFQHPTIKGLASVAGKSKPIVAEQGILEGNVALTPIQHWFFEQQFEKKDHWNQSILLEVAEPLDENILRETFNILVKHHDVLRLRFKINEGVWTQYYSEVDNNDSVRYMQLKNEQANGQENILELECQKVQESLNINNGPIIKFAYFNLGQEQNDRLLIVAHHLVIDGVSWRIIVEDIQKIYSQIQNGIEPKLPLKTTSYSYWASSLIKNSNSKLFTDDIKFWQNQKELLDSIDTNNDVENCTNLEKTASIISRQFPSEKTEKIIKDVTKNLNTEVKEILISSLIRAYSRISGKRVIPLTMEGHGREDIFDDVDISRTIGWFTSLFPIVFDLGESISPSESLKNIKQTLRSIPQNGLSYSILKYLNNNINNGDLPHLSEICFNYLGVFSNRKQLNNHIFVASENKGSERNDLNQRPFQIDISCSIVDGELKINWIYNSNKFSDNYMNELSNNFMDELEKIIDSSLTDSQIYIASDFVEGDEDLAENDLDSILSELGEGADDE